MFKTKSEIEAGKATFINLRKYAGWKLVVQILQANIEELTKQIVGGIEGETDENMNRKRDKLKVYKEVIDLPDSMIRELSVTVPQQDENDPYEMVDVEDISEKGVLDI